MRIPLAVLAGITAMLLMYLLGAFTAADFNIINWHEDGRFMIGLFMLFGGVGSFLCVLTD